MTVDLVLATHNAHKVREVQEIVARLAPGVRLVGWTGDAPVEDGVTFAENALIKARAASADTGLPALADDSGIAVDVMGGSPGILSARWSGRHGDDVANRELLLAQLRDVARAHRGAAFVCALALIGSGGTGSGRRRVRRHRAARRRARRRRGQVGGAHRGAGRRHRGVRLRPRLRARRPRDLGGRARSGAEERHQPPGARLRRARTEPADPRGGVNRGRVGPSPTPYR